jgi:hypothetical protein
MPPPIEDIQEVFEICRKTVSTHIQVEKLIHLLKKPGNESLLLSTDSQGWTPLMTAVFHGHTEIVMKILNMNTALLENPRIRFNIYHKSASGATALDLAEASKHKQLIPLLKGEIARSQRLKKNPVFIGYHETSLDGYNFIIEDRERQRFPMIGGTGGYFGGGIYFAASEQESSAKALSHGIGFKCNLRMGNVYKINTYAELLKFYKRYIELGDESVSSYSIPVDVMQERLLQDGYDSVWGHHDKTIHSTKRILKSGDEYIVFSADQVDIQNFYHVVKRSFNFTYIPKLLKRPFNYPLRDPLTSLNSIWHVMSPLKSNIVPPKRHAKVFKINYETIPEPFSSPLSVQETRDLLNRQRAPNTPEIVFETGDIIDFTHPDDEYEGIRICVFVKYSHNESFIPYLTSSVRSNKILLDIQEYTDLLFIHKHFLEQLTCFTPKSFEEHYTPLLEESKGYLIEEMQLSESHLVKYLPILKQPKYHYYLQFLKDTVSLASDETNTYLVQTDSYNSNLLKPIALLAGRGIQPTEEIQLKCLTTLLGDRFYSMNFRLDIVIVFNCKKYRYNTKIEIDLLKQFPSVVYPEYQTVPDIINLKDIDKTDYIKIDELLHNPKSLPILQLNDQVSTESPLFTVEPANNPSGNIRIELECYYTEGDQGINYKEYEDEYRELFSINDRIFSPNILYKLIPKKLLDIKPVTHNGMRTIHEFDFKQNLGCLLGFNTISSMAKTQLEVLNITKRVEKALQAEFKKKQISLPLLSGMIV